MPRVAIGPSIRLVARPAPLLLLHALCSTSILAPSLAAAQLEAHEGVREASRRVHVTIHRGLARVETTVLLESASDVRSEVELSVATPERAALDRARVCIQRRCREAVHDRSPEGLGAYALDLVAPRPHRRAVLPVASVSPRGRVRAAPVSRGEPLELRVSHVVPIELHGGQVSLALPVEGAGAVEVSVSAPGFGEARVDGEAGPVTLAPGSIAHVSATIPAGARLGASWRVACGAQTCTRVWLGSALSTRPRDVLLAIDASPSMEDVPAERTQRATAAVLAALPQGSTVRAVAFARDLEVRVAEPADPSSVDAASLLAPPGALGNTTTLREVLERAGVWLAGGRDPLVVVVGDGLIGAPRPPSGVAVSVVNVADERVSSTIAAAVEATGGVVVELGPRMEGGAPLEPHLAILSATVAFAEARMPGAPSRALFAGEALEWSGVGLPAASAAGVDLRPRAPPAALARGLERWLVSETNGDAGADLVAVDPSDFEAARVWQRPGERAYPAVRGAVEVEHRVTPVGLEGPCDPSTSRGRLSVCGQRVVRLPRLRPCFTEVRGSLSREGVRRIMDHIRPAVRACFADARRGRRDFEASFTYRLLLGEREVVQAAIADASPSVDARLAQCLLDRPIRSLVVPRFDGMIEVSYPFHTDRQPPPVRVELDPDVEALLDGLAEP